IIKAFREAIEERKRTFIVLIKGILKKDLKGVIEVEFSRSIRLSIVERILIREGITRAIALISLAS
ncbi:hypothetical protein B0J18DRAFT_367204, partial [Chaetomium sp. MPI-SDFR-AT-0129]